MENKTEEVLGSVYVRNRDEVQCCDHIVHVQQCSNERVIGASLTVFLHSQLKRPITKEVLRFNAEQGKSTAWVKVYRTNYADLERRIVEMVEEEMLAKHKEDFN